VSKIRSALKNARRRIEGGNEQLTPQELAAVEKRCSELNEMSALLAKMTVTAR
jgi:hypothetical protein